MVVVSSVDRWSPYHMTVLRALVVLCTMGPLISSFYGFPYPLTIRWGPCTVLDYESLNPPTPLWGFCTDLYYGSSHYRSPFHLTIQWGPCTVLHLGSPNYLYTMNFHIIWLYCGIHVCHLSYMATLVLSALWGTCIAVRTTCFLSPCTFFS